MAATCCAVGSGGTPGAGVRPWDGGVRFWTVRPASGRPTASGSGTYLSAPRGRSCSTHDRAPASRVTPRADRPPSRRGGRLALGQRRAASAPAPSPGASPVVAPRPRSPARGCACACRAAPQRPRPPRGTPGARGRAASPATPGPRRARLRPTPAAHQPRRPRRRHPAHRGDGAEHGGHAASHVPGRADAEVDEPNTGAVRDAVRDVKEAPATADRALSDPRADSRERADVMRSGQVPRQTRRASAR